MMAGTGEIRPYRVDVPQGRLDDLRERLDRTRWPDELPGVGWSYLGPLTDPASHGAPRADAFHVVALSLLLPTA